MNRFFTVIFLLFTLLFLHVTAYSAEKVETIEARIKTSSAPPLVKKRMETTVEAIASQLIAGRVVARAEETKARDAEVIREVFDKVLVGYTVGGVELTPGKNTRIEISLIPWADVISSVDVETEIEGMPPYIETLVRNDLENAGRVFAEGLAGLPVAASDWTNGVLKRSLNEYMEEHLPEFRADFDVVPDTDTKVTLTVYPRLPVVRTVELNMRSDSVPNFFLINYHDQLRAAVNTLIGVPVDFVKRHDGDLSSHFASELDNAGEFRALGLKSTFQMTHGTDMSVTCRSNTENFLIRLEGWADISRKRSEDRDLIFRFHAGRRFTKRDELFIQTDFSPQSVKWDLEFGYARRLTPSAKAQIRYDVEKSRFTAGFEQLIRKDWLLRYEYRWTDHRGEAAIRYRLHDFLGIEYAFDNEDSWVRLIGYF